MTPRLRREASEARNKYFFGSSSVRSFRPGHRFYLSQGPFEAAPGGSAEAERQHFVLLGERELGLAHPTGGLELLPSGGYGNGWIKNAAQPARHWKPCPNVATLAARLISRLSLGGL